MLSSVLAIPHGGVQTNALIQKGVTALTLHLPILWPLLNYGVAHARPPLQSPLGLAFDSPLGMGIYFYITLRKRKPTANVNLPKS